MTSQSSNSAPTAGPAWPVKVISYNSWRSARFALGKFRLPPLPATLVTRPVLHERLMAGLTNA